MDILLGGDGLGGLSNLSFFFLISFSTLPLGSPYYALIVDAAFLFFPCIPPTL